MRVLRYKYWVVYLLLTGAVYLRMCVQADTPGADHGLAVSIDVDEAELLNDVEMGGMSHGELVAHIRTVQQELLAKVRRGAAALHFAIGLAHKLVQAAWMTPTPGSYRYSGYGPSMPEVYLQLLQARAPGQADHLATTTTTPIIHQDLSRDKLGS
jgi:hypothetical protein